VELAWWAFVVLNVAGILAFREWATVPFHFIWISLALVYGWRTWSLRSTMLVLGVVIAATGTSLWLAVLSGDQAVDELTEIPLMSAVFLAMVWFVRREVAAREETARVSERNLTLLRREQQFLQEASHMLRTPLTVAMGYSEVLQRASTDPGEIADLQLVIDELHRLRRITDRLLSLARAEQVEFIALRPTSAAELVVDTHRRWAGSSPAIRLGRVEDGVLRVDRDRITEALDELIGNAVAHTPEGTVIELGCWYDAGNRVLSVTDNGPGIPETDLVTIFDRWARGATSARHRPGLGIGLAIVKAVAEAHHGTVTVASGPRGTSFELRLPDSRAQSLAGSGMLTGRSNAR
jgi:signal transduction histidine kinase